MLQHADVVVLDERRTVDGIWGPSAAPAGARVEWGPHTEIAVQDIVRWAVRGMAVQDRLAVQVGLGAGSEGTAGGAGALWVETGRGRRVRDGGGEHPWAQLVACLVE